MKYSIKIGPAVLLVYILGSMITIIRANEYIDLFQADLKIAQNGSMLITETIEYVISMSGAKRGIIRKIPTLYTTPNKSSYEIGFLLMDIKKDGHKISYKEVDSPNGKTLFIGSENKFLPAGKHIYTIKYLTNKHISFFQNYDELYWNITGNGWPFTICKAKAIVFLPLHDNNTQKDITAEAYVGPQGSKNGSYRAQIEHNKISIETTRILKPYEGFTIAVTWPKGIINEEQSKKAPILKEQTFSTIFKPFAPFWLLISCIIVISIYIKAWYSKRQKSGTIIPLFYPPKGVSAGVVSYIYNMGFTPKTFAVQLVDLAVHGFITIDLHKKFFRKIYILEYKKNHPKEVTLEQDILLKVLFTTPTEKIELTEKYRDLISKAQETIQKSYDESLKSSLFDYSLNYQTWALLISIIGFIVPLMAGISSLLIGYAFIIFLVHFIGFKIIRSYTQEGRTLMNEIEGFKLFLTATEQERFKIIGTEPTRTPELYEKYLPYAMALGVEEQWTKQFVPIFEKLKQTGKPYAPVWYQGTGLFARNFSILYFTSGLQSSLSSLISVARSTSIISASKFPGSSSGSRGGGSSGGGFGGGGGGSW